MQESTQHWIQCLKTNARENKLDCSALELLAYCDFEPAKTLLPNKIKLSMPADWSVQRKRLEYFWGLEEFPSQEFTKWVFGLERWGTIVSNFGYLSGFFAIKNFLLQQFSGLSEFTNEIQRILTRVKTQEVVDPENLTAEVTAQRQLRTKLRSRMPTLDRQKRRLLSYAGICHSACSQLYHWQIDPKRFDYQPQWHLTYCFYQVGASEVELLQTMKQALIDLILFRNNLLRS